MTRLRRPRWLQRVYARVFGYCWTSCRECGRMFGGHEAARGGVCVATPDGSFVVCRECGLVVADRQVAEVSELLARFRPTNDPHGEWERFLSRLDRGELWL